MTDPGVPELVARLAPGASVVDLGGSDSLNLLLTDLGTWAGRLGKSVVLRVNKPFVTRQRILGDQKLRRYLAARGLGVAAPIDASVFRCGVYWAQLEEYVPHLTPTTGSHVARWLLERANNREG